MLGELNQQQIDQVLRSEAVGRIGCHAEGKTYVVPVCYAYDGECIYGDTTEGLKLRMMRANPRVCFEVDHMDSLANWRSVIAWGTFEELGGEEASRVMQLLLNRYLPLLGSETGPSQRKEEGTGAPEAHMTGRTAVIYRIRLTEKTGRFEKR
jgi:nitroimidazol reductase NimA-like FMN-containing flavoprotein (pyridoxamine 5'-phosphate oxidase superfamily)